MDEENKYSEREFKLGQLAAFVDGEGNIGISEDRRYQSYEIYLRITNTCKDLTDWLKNNFGGYNYRNIREGNRKEQHEWGLHGRNAWKLVEQVKPYLIIKEKQAELAIELGSMQLRNNNRRRPKWMVEKQSEIHQKMKKLNWRGKY